MREEELKIKQALIKWFSGLPLHTNHAIAKDMSALLGSFTGLKTRRGNQCHFMPCGNTERARGVCHRHYGILRRIAKHTGWTELWLQNLYPLRTWKEIRIARNAVKVTQEQREKQLKDPLRVLVTKSE